MKVMIGSCYQILSPYEHEIQRSKHEQGIAASDSRDRWVPGFHLDRWVR